MELSYDTLKEEIIRQFGESKIMVLATASNNRVTARSMSCVFDGLKIMFQTDSSFLKTSQIKENPQVALCFNNIQIEGVANITRHPTDDDFIIFINKFEKHYEDSYKAYSHSKNEIVVVVNPTLITLWKYEDGKPLRDFLSVAENRACREYYNINT